MLANCGVKAVTLPDGKIHHNHAVNPTYVMFVAWEETEGFDNCLVIRLHGGDTVRWIFDGDATQIEAVMSKLG